MSRFTFTIPDEKLDEFLEAFVVGQPMPAAIEGEPQMTPRQWYRYKIREWSMNIYRAGKRKQVKIEIDEDIIT